jgi:hypothetical protein
LYRHAAAAAGCGRDGRRCHGASSSDLLQVDFAAEPSPSAARMSVLAGYPDVEVEHGFVQRGRGLVLALRVE